MPDVATAPAPGPAATPPPTSISPADAASAAPAQAGSSMADAFGNLESRGQSLEQIATAPAPTAKPKVPARAKPPDQKPTEKTPEKAAAVPEGDKPAEIPKESAAPAAVPKPGEKSVETSAVAEKPKTGWQRFHEAEKVIKDLTAKLADKEKAATMLEDHPELVRRQTEIARLQKELGDRENYLRYRDYEESQEFKEKYQKPYDETAVQATQRAVQLQVKNEVDGTTRALTPKEFWKIVHIDDADAAINAAEALFGEGSAKVNFLIERRNEILLANERAEGAKAAFKTDAAEITRKKQEEFQRQGTERSTLFKKLMTEGIEKDPALYKPEEGDAKGNALLENGFRLVDRVFSGGPPEVDGGTPMSAQEMIAAHAEIRNNAAAFPRIAHKYKAAVARIAELESELEEYQTSTPAKGEAATGEKGPAREDDMESILSGLKGDA